MKDNFEKVTKNVLKLEFEDEEIDELLTLLIRAERQKKDRGYDTLGIEAKMYAVVAQANDDRWS